MTNENNRRRNQVSRQSWKPSRTLRLLKGIWTGAYSVLKIVLGALATVFVIAAVCVFAFVGILAAYLENDIISSAGFELENYELNQTSFVYYIDSDGDIQVLQKLYADINREWVSFEDLPEDLIHATVAIEDKRFFEHQGVDWFTTVKACVNMFLGGDSQFGGSSITQQLIKNLTTEDSVTVQRKVMEIFRATKFEKQYDKSVVLEWYLNTIYLGNRCYGVKSAAAKYFGKELENLTVAEFASLISITNNPSIFDPYGNTFKYKGEEMTGQERNRARQVNVLKEMCNQGWISREKYEEAIAQEMVFKSGIAPEDKMAECTHEGCGYRGTVGTFSASGKDLFCPKCGFKVQVDEDASQYYYSWFVDTVLEDVAQAMAEQNGVEWNDETKKNYIKLISQGGYHIYTTFDMEAQQAVDKIYTNLEEIPEDRSVQQLQSSMVIIDNRTGDIIAMAGGVGEKAYHDAYNRATDAKLQPGSSIKPLTVFAPAIELGIMNPASLVYDLPLYYDEDRPFPRNDTRDYVYTYSMLQGLVYSINAISVNVLDQIGTSYSYDFAKNSFRLDYLTDHYVSETTGKVLTDVGYAPLGLGAPTIGVTVRQMAAAYATFANNGVYREARTFTKVYDSEGNLVLDNTKDRDMEQILALKTCEYLSYVLQTGVDPGPGASGGLAAYIEGQAVAGKTGTTNDSKDRWFCGYSDYYTAAVWVGYDTPETINLMWNNTNPAGTLFKKVLSQIHEGKEKVPLYDKSNFVQVAICLDCGKLATSACDYDPRNMDSKIPRKTYAMVYEEDIPTDVCDCHEMVEFCKECDAVANEYCKLLAQVGKATIIKRSLCKMTQEMVDKLEAASEHGLYEAHTKDNYIYLVDEDGEDVPFKGIFGTINANNKLPYMIGTEHTEADWRYYLLTHPGYSGN